MQAHGIRAKQARRFQVTTESRHGFAIAPNLLGRAFAATAPNRVRMGDLTFIPTGQGWGYLAVLIDAFSRRVVGWALDTQPSAALPLTVWRHAVASRRPGPGLLHHSDRGVQYACTAYQRVLRQHDVVCSMSRRGDCWDNAVVESFFASLKVERLHERRYATIEELREDIADCIERFLQPTAAAHDPGLSQSCDLRAPSCGLNHCPLERGKVTRIAETDGPSKRHSHRSENRTGHATSALPPALA
jgi:putative transposase